MKKLLLLSTLLCGTSLFGASTLDNISSFMQMAQKAKLAWENFEQRFMNAKFNLKKQQEADTFSLHEKELANLKANGCTDKLFQEKLADKIALCERHMAEMKALCDSYHNEANQMHNAGTTMLDRFKESIGSMASSALGGYKYGAPQGGTFMDNVRKVLETLKAGVPAA